MQKLINYFKQGNGRGWRAMLIFSILIALLTWGIFCLTLKDISTNPELNKFIGQLPTISIQNGEVVEPQNANLVYFVKNQPIFYLQSDRATVLPNSPDGYYLTRNTFAVVAAGQIQQVQALSGTIKITPEGILKAIHLFAIWVPVLLAIFYFVTLWIFYLIATAISALICLISCFKLNKGAVWRSASFATIAVLLIDIVMGLFGYSVGRATYPLIVQLITCVLLVLLIAFGIREKTAPKKEDKKKK